MLQHAHMQYGRCQPVGSEKKRPHWCRPWHLPLMQWSQPRADFSTVATGSGTGGSTAVLAGADGSNVPAARSSEPSTSAAHDAITSHDARERHVGGDGAAIL
mmetsp:Transcript_26243/g.67826  ORF Transcript_26243/g.67826 Transcript_26243/m.67826 type:complete len:102 (-) Transcript_26243:14-319(-)